MELGGNAPLIIFKDADIEAAVVGAIACKYRNSGQTCVCANRIFVQDEVYDEFSEKFAERASKLKVADGRQGGSEIGPLIDMAAIEKVEEHIEDAIKNGANIIA